MSTQMTETKDQLIFRGTNKAKGRHTSVSPENSSMKHLVYGRVILDQTEPRAALSTGKLESSLICMSGECTIKSGDETNYICQYASIYLPPETEVEIMTDS